MNFEAKEGQRYASVSCSYIDSTQAGKLPKGWQEQFIFAKTQRQCGGKQFCHLKRSQYRRQGGIGELLYSLGIFLVFIYSVFEEGIVFGDDCPY